ncbi:hypothetical protein ACFS5L_14625 [Streptomyces phyllanthi]|nr:hypothetical protein [Streptomyces phyllanthi]
MKNAPDGTQAGLQDCRNTAAVNRGAHFGRLHRPYGTVVAA